MTTRPADEQVEVYLLAMRLSCSGKAVHRMIASRGTRRSSKGTSTLSVPTGKVRHDNL